jgi:hypothetical protein
MISFVMAAAANNPGTPLPMAARVVIALVMVAAAVGFIWGCVVQGLKSGVIRNRRGMVYTRDQNAGMFWWTTMFYVVIAGLLLVAAGYIGFVGVTFTGR